MNEDNDDSLINLEIIKLINVNDIDNIILSYNNLIEKIYNSLIKESKLGIDVDGDIIKKYHLLDIIKVYKVEIIFLYEQCKEYLKNNNLLYPYEESIILKIYKIVESFLLDDNMFQDYFVNFLYAVKTIIRRNNKNEYNE